MSRRRSLIGLAAVALLACAAVGGYLVGAAGAPGEDDAVAGGQIAFAIAFSTARAEGVIRGLDMGTAAGATAGATRGRRRGAAAGRRAAQPRIKAARARPLRQGDRRESEGEIGSAADLPGTGEVLVVGDSLQVLTSPYLSDYLPSVPLEVNAEGGYNSYQIFDLFEESYEPSQSVIVFDAGTNDNPAYPEILAENLRAVARMVGDRCMVVPTIHGLTVDGVDSRGKNRVVRAFAASRPGTQVPDWAGMVAARPDLMQSDDLHPIAAGANARARLIAEGIMGCLGGSTGGVGK